MNFKNDIFQPSPIPSSTKTPFRQPKQQYLYSPSVQRKNSLKINGDQFIPDRKSSSTTIESLDLQHQFVQNFPPSPAGLIPANSTTHLSQVGFNEIDVNGNNIIEPDLRADVDTHACQLHNDILSQCLDNSGTYTCKEFSPRCYIIQKVRKARHFVYKMSLRSSM